jgi:hypothetical protein
MSMIFFYFLKIIFNIGTSKRFKKYKPHLILVKKKIQNLAKRSYKRNAKQSLSKPIHPALARVNLLASFYVSDC